MGTDKPSGEKAAQSTSEITAAQNGQFLIWGGYVCGTLAFVLWPIILGPVGIALGAVNIRRGDRKHGEQIVGLGVLGLIGGLVIGWVFSGDPAYVGECRSVWWERQGRFSPAVDVSYQRAGGGEMTRRSDGRLVGYYTDIVITEKFDNFGKQGRINLQCVANSKETFTYMKLDDPDWIGGKPGPMGPSFYRADGAPSPFPPNLD
jgi:hypothetical protein